MTMTNLPHIAFFGTPDIAVWVLVALEEAGILPTLIVTNPDAPQGRKMLLTPPPVKVWADAHGIETMQPTSLMKDTTVAETLRARGIELILVAAYGKLIPQTILDIPRHGTLNVHPSLLPHFRGASPIRSAILSDARDTGVTVMLIDAELDHGPILAQEPANIPKETWPMGGHALDELLARKGGALLAKVIPQWLQGTLTPHAQDHDNATFCTKITKDMGELNLHGDAYQNLLKIRAFEGWPGTYFFHERHGKRLRVKVAAAHIAHDELIITRVIPEGKSEMDFDVFMRE